MASAATSSDTTQTQTFTFPKSENIHECLLERHPLTNTGRFTDAQETRIKIIVLASAFFANKAMTELEIKAAAKEIVADLVKSGAIEKYTNVYVQDCLWKALHDIVNPKCLFYWEKPFDGAWDAY